MATQLLSPGLLSFLTLLPSPPPFSVSLGSRNGLSTLAPLLALPDSPEAELPSTVLSLALAHPFSFASLHFLFFIFWLEGLTTQVDLHKYMLRKTKAENPN